ncbi:hypothetical protein Aph02nite_76520 [Actinoplanes philippinensis]|uniref:Uncharacterized protein n=1 Tax=Actinoplanes philippinensis TaxID=35752 RepID=A0A1I2HGW0_9ACTN|nr:hypothetical protein [Actinoplanes philippinensis]GIE81702.1 hypothetical protein Aph02nite_76520 [Actinoplanes philippinensis]SFF27996.1 hypothetical protein SAMN05421541_10892 [Actinoplanes philippinensis]
MSTVDEPAPTPDVEDIEALEEQLATVQIREVSGLFALHNEGGMHQHIHKQVKGLRDASALSSDYVRRTLDTLVERKFQAFGRDVDSTEAERLLRAHHCLVLMGEPDTGRRTAAVGVLGRLDLPLEEIPAWDPGQPQQFAVSDLPAAADMGYLFKHPTGVPANSDFRTQLNSYVDKLSKLGSYLVVVATSTEWHATGAAVAENVLSVAAPSPRAVLLAEIRYRARRTDLQTLLDDQRIHSLIRQARPREVIRLAELILAVADVPDEDPGSGQQLATIAEAFQEWTEALTVWFQQHHSATERTFLLAAAILENAPARLVLRYAERLGESLDGSPTGRYDISAAGIRELAKEVGAEVAEADGRLRFTRPAYGPAVLDFFLKDRSDTFRMILRDWFAKAPVVSRRSADAPELIAEALLGITIRHRDTSFLPPVVKAWADQPSLRRALIPLLTGTALSPEAGSLVRQLLNLWATKSSSTQIRQVVAEVCSSELADAYPRIALTRINNLAIRATDETAESIVTAVLRLWERPRLRRDVATKVLGWASERGSPAFGVATAVLTALGVEAIWVAYENRLPTGPALRSLLRPPGVPEEVRETLYSWLDLAVADSVFAAWLVTAIADAIPGPAPALMITAVRGFTHEWQGRDAMTPRAAFRERLLERITVLGWETSAARKDRFDEPSA